MTQTKPPGFGIPGGSTESAAADTADDTGYGLSIPDLAADADALTYAAAGWYVVPVLRGSKNPGSVVGDRWQDKSSRDPQVIAAWFAGTNHGIALHCGRSGAVVFDVDKPELIPDVLARHIGSAPYQSTRPATPGRGHYVFAMPPGRTIGNSGGRLGGAWGEVRGLNGVIMVAPSLHPDGGEYRWVRTGTVPVLPDELAELLNDASPAEDAATDAQVLAFLSDHQGDERPAVLAGLVKTLTVDYAAGKSRHQATVAVTAGAMKEARAGFYPAQGAADVIRAMFLTEVTKQPAPGGKQGPPRSGMAAESEWAGILAWAVGQALAADLGKVRARVEQKMFDNRAWANGNASPNGQLLDGQPVPGKPLGQAGDSPPGDSPPDIDEEAFWNACDELRSCRDYARAVRVGPWAMLGAALADAAATIPPFVVLPPQVGAPASVNLYVALCGPSGAIKSAAIAAAHAWLKTSPAPDRIKPGSGQGIAKCFAYVKKQPKDGTPEQVGKLWSAVAVINEVDTLTSAGKMTGSSLWAEFRSAWSGERVGHDYADAAKTVVLQPHRYRLCMVVGVQPLRAAPLFDDADAGTPQRFMWMPTDDPGAPDEPPDAVPSLVLPPWSMAAGGGGFFEQWPDRLDEPPDADEFITLAVPAEARAAVNAAATAKLRRTPGADPLDGHRLLCRLKVAAALARLRRHGDEITSEDWQLAGTVMAVSDRTRAQVQAALAAADAARNVNDAKAAGQRKVVESEVMADAEATAVARVGQVIVTKLGRAEGGVVSWADARKAVRSNDRARFEKALECLETDGRVRVDAVDERGGRRVVLLQQTP